MAKRKMTEEELTEFWANYKPPEHAVMRAQMFVDALNLAAKKNRDGEEKKSQNVNNSKPPAAKP
jgi:hypothetical protein